MSNFLENVARPDGFVFNAIKKQQDQAKNHEHDPGPILGPDNNPLKEGQCICGEFNCKSEYSCWTSGF
jgi:hypothetical protein|tara:strand:+ start:303 stop:506 length:204 start_codon:yes stop_codon:yes gene_type:complete